MKNTIKLCLVALCLGITSHIQAAVVVTTSATAPISNVAISNEAASTGNLSARYTGDAAAEQRDLGQTFTLLSAITLDKISVFTPGASPTTISRNFTLTIESFATSSVASTRTVISSQIGVLQSIGSGNQWITFDLGDDVSLVAGTVYGFRFGFDTISSSSILAWNQTSASSYAGGTGYNIIYSTSSTPAALNADFQFALISTAVPEPGTVLLLMGAGLLFVCFRRRRSRSQPLLS